MSLRSTEAKVNVSALNDWLRRAGLALAVLLPAMAAASCGSETVREGRGGSFLILEALEAASGAESSPIFTTVLQSDVQTGGGVFEDPGRVRFRLALKDVGPISSPTTPSTNNFITVYRYRVVFQRADGRNVPGVDVPYPFDGGVTFTVGTAPVSGVFSIVRAQSKLEAPLKALGGLGGDVLISTLAEVTFYGRDQVGNETTISGMISVNFADWADPD
jgi:hypothetical protein